MLSVSGEKPGVGESVRPELVKIKKKGQRVLWNSIQEFPSGMGHLGSAWKRQVSLRSNKKQASPEPVIREERLIPNVVWATVTSALRPHVPACLLSCFSHLRLFETLWTEARQAHLYMGFSRQEYWTGLSCPPPGDLPDPGMEPASSYCLLHWQVDSLPPSHWESPRPHVNLTYSWWIPEHGT